MKNVEIELDNVEIGLDAACKMLHKGGLRVVVADEEGKVIISSPTMEWDLAYFSPGYARLTLARAHDD